jgi:hypothetical protein
MESVIIFQGERYPRRVINNQLYTTDELQADLYTTGGKYVSGKAVELDQIIAGYLTPVEFDTLSDDEVIDKFKNI